ncbi:MAG: FecCD family ABC transporter permease [Fibrobacterota bacterium]
MKNILLEKYRRYALRKILAGLVISAGLLLLILYSLKIGSYETGIKDLLRVITGVASNRLEIIILGIRLPRIIAAVFAGAGLAFAGTVMQCLLRNPLASPFTMGVSQGAAFGAAFAIIVFGAGQASNGISGKYLTGLCAFSGSLASVTVILFLAGLRALDYRAIILGGVAMGSLFGAGTMFLQFFAEDVEVASVVFWSFGDPGRVSWGDLKIIIPVVTAGGLYFFHKSWEYNIVEGGEETAAALGVKIKRTRISGVLISALMTAVCVSFMGIIGFTGLIAPHITRKIVGGDHRFLIPVSAAAGALLLLGADTAARTIMSPEVLPVGILTSFFGAPLFIYLISRKGGRGL